uniref:Uncharacterized protein n=1 Tax=Rhizophora mucronata TaxID=61149 RepID=A0A2P2J3W0_RHIMU
MYLYQETSFYSRVINPQEIFFNLSPQKPCKCV